MSILLRVGSTLGCSIGATWTSCFRSGLDPSRTYRICFPGSHLTDPPVVGECYRNVRWTS